MKKIFFLLSIFILNTSLFVQAQSLYENKSDYEESLSGMRLDVTSSLVENRKLEGEYQRLRQQYENLRAEIVQYEDVLQQLGQTAEKKKTSIEQIDETVETMSKKMDNFQSDFFLKKSKNAHYNGKVLDRKEGKNLWELKLADLEYQHSELAMQLKLKEYLYKEEAMKEREETARLQLAVEANRKKEQDLTTTIQRLEKQRLLARTRKRRLAQENLELEHKIAVAQKEKEFAQRKNKLLQDKSDLAAQKKDTRLRKLEVEKKYLLEEISQAEERYDSLSARVTEFIDRQEKDKALLESISTLDQENQALIEKIVKMREQVEEIKKK